MEAGTAMMCIRGSFGFVLLKPKSNARLGRRTKFPKWDTMPCKIPCRDKILALLGRIFTPSTGCHLRKASREEIQQTKMLATKSVGQEAAGFP